ncbi:MAG: hypothetical protein JO287_22290 [Pseudonocardiales bacterium]|nr:hypothetical protein [Pseudonocardiales bacterium]
MGDINRSTIDEVHQISPVLTPIVHSVGVYELKLPTQRSSCGRRRSSTPSWRGSQRAATTWRRADLLIMPTVPTTFTVDEIAEEPVRRNMVLGRFTQFVNLLDLAAITVPAGQTTDGRPASVTLIGPAFSEPLLLSVATRLTDP